MQSQLLLDWRSSRSPHGERGLKFIPIRTTDIAGASLSSRRAWIEISTFPIFCEKTASLSSRRAWIEMQEHYDRYGRDKGRSPHGERGLKCIVRVFGGEGRVALLTESVD